MSLSRVKTWIAGEILYAADLNTEIDNILQNGSALLFPITSNIDMDGNTIILDANGGAQLRAGSTNLIELLLASSALFRFDGTVAAPVNGLDFVASATGARTKIMARGSDTDIDIDLVPKGAGVVKIGGTALANQTAAQVLASLLTVDGSGSGLDADLLDGKNTGDSGNVVPLLDGNNTYSGTANFTSTLQQSGKAVLAHAGSYTSGQVTASTSSPSGGSNGDIWLKY